MSKDIKISPKYGVNPTIPVCFFCGEHKNEIALMGKMKGDIEAPKNMVLDYEPCEHCKEQWDMGVPLIECVTSSFIGDDRPHISVDPATDELLYPTGRHCVVKIEAAKRMFNVPDEQIQLGKPILIAKEVMEMIYNANR